MNPKSRFVARLHDLDARRSRARGRERRLEHRGADTAPDVREGLSWLKPSVSQYRHDERRQHRSIVRVALPRRADLHRGLQIAPHAGRRLEVVAAS